MQNISKQRKCKPKKKQRIKKREEELDLAFQMNMSRVGKEKSIDGKNEAEKAQSKWEKKGARLKEKISRFLLKILTDCASFQKYQPSSKASSSLKKQIDRIKK